MYFEDAVFFFKIWTRFKYNFRSFSDKQTDHICMYAWIACVLSIQLPSNSYWRWGSINFLL